MSIYEVGLVKVNHGIVWATHTAVLDGSGVLELVLNSNSKSSSVTLANGDTLKGIRILDGGEPLILDDDDFLLVIRSNGVSFIAHESLDVTEPTERTITSSGVTVGVDGRRIQIWYSKSSGVWRWEVPDWSV